MFGGDALRAVWSTPQRRSADRPGAASALFDSWVRSVFGILDADALRAPIASASPGEVGVPELGLKRLQPGLLHLWREAEAGCC